LKLSREAPNLFFTRRSSYPVGILIGFTPSPFVTMQGNIQRYLDFQREQIHTLPPSMAVAYLGMSRQAVFDAVKKKKLATIKVAGTHHFGLRSLRLFKAMREAKLRN
jgi:adenylosuccinate lyase